MVCPPMVQSPCRGKLPSWLPYSWLGRPEVVVRAGRTRTHAGHMQVRMPCAHTHGSYGSGRLILCLLPWHRCPGCASCWSHPCRVPGYMCGWKIYVYRNTDGRVCIDICMFMNMCITQHVNMYESMLCRCVCGHMHRHVQARVQTWIPMCIDMCMCRGVCADMCA